MLAADYDASESVVIIYYMGALVRHKFKSIFVFFKASKISFSKAQISNHLPKQSSAFFDPGGDILPSVQFVQVLVLSELHVPPRH